MFREPMPSSLDILMTGTVLVGLVVFLLASAGVFFTW